MLRGPRLRQVAVVAHNCDLVVSELQQHFGWTEPFHDPGVGEFGLTNAVFAVGDTFVEVAAPAWQSELLRGSDSAQRWQGRWGLPAGRQLRQ